MDGAQINPLLKYDFEAYTRGQRAFDHLGNEYLFGQVSDLSFSTLPTAGSGAVILADGTIRRMAAGHGQIGDRIGVSLQSMGSNEYGWVQIYGSGIIQAAANASRNVHLYTSSGGRFGDVTTNQERLRRIYLTETRGPSNGPAPAVWAYPFYA